MRRSYLFVYSDDVGPRDDVRDFLDSVPEILNWRYDLPNSFYLVSEKSANELAQKVREFTKDSGRFIILEITKNKQGWLPKSTWTMINRKSLPNKLE